MKVVNANMKKYFIIFLLSLFSNSLYSQIIGDKFVDRIEEDGSRLIVTKHKAVAGNFKMFIEVGLVDIIEVNEQESYYLSIGVIGNHKKPVSKGRKLLLKLKDESMIDLENYIKRDVKDYEGYKVILRYKVDEGIIQKIIDGGVIKIRVENDVDYKDCSVKKNAFSKTVKKAFDIIQEEKMRKSPDVYDGF